MTFFSFTNHPCILFSVMLPQTISDHRDWSCPPPLVQVVRLILLLFIHKNPYILHSGCGSVHSLNHKVIGYTRLYWFYLKRFENTDENPRENLTTNCKDVHWVINLYYLNNHFDPWNITLSADGPMGRWPTNVGWRKIWVVILPCSSNRRINGEPLKTRHICRLRTLFLKGNSLCQSLLSLLPLILDSNIVLLGECLYTTHLFYDVLLKFATIF